MFASLEKSLPISRCGFLLLLLGPCTSLLAEAEIRRVAVESSNLASVGYDGRTRVLEIEFRNGGVYRYFGVPKGIFAALMAAESKGGYFSAHIKNQFRFAKLKQVAEGPGK